MDEIRKIVEILPPHEFIKSSFKENPIELAIAAEFYRILNEFLNDQQQIDEQSLHDTYTMCEAIKDHLWEVINTGHFSKVDRIQRQLLTLASLEKAVLLLIQGHFNRNASNEMRDKCIWELDNGLLLGCPFDHPIYCQILNDCLKILQNSNLNPDKSMAIAETMPAPILNSNTELHREPNEICDLNIVAKPSVQHFQEHYFNKCWPVLLTECMDQWPAMVKWTQPSYLLNVCANRTVPIEIGSTYTNENWSQDLVKFEDFFRRQFLNVCQLNTGSCTAEQSTSNVEYLAQHNLFDQIPTLRNDIIIPEYCCAINRANVMDTTDGGTDDDIDVDIKAWLGPEGTTSPMHIDEKHNLLCQVFGSKRIILAAPSDTINLYPFDGDMLKNTAQIDAEHLDFDRFPLVRHVKFYHLTLHKGEILYIPPKWWHFVRSLSKSFSVSFWWE